MYKRGIILNFTGSQETFDRRLYSRNTKESHCGFVLLADQAASGPGLCFIAFTDAINQMPGSTFWALLFFLMLLALGLDSLFGALESVTTALQDVRGFKKLRKEVLSGKGSFSGERERERERELAWHQEKY